MDQPHAPSSRQTPSYRLRPAEEGDREFCYQLNRSTMKPYIEATWGPWNDQQQRALFGEKWWTPGKLNHTRIVEIHGQPAGLLIALPRGGEHYLAEIQIHPDHQGRGIGSDLVRRIIREAHPAPVTLQVLKTNPAARRLYKRLGFTVTGQSGTHYFMRRHPDPNA